MNLTRSQGPLYPEAVGLSDITRYHALVDRESGCRATLRRRRAWAPRSSLDHFYAAFGAEQACEIDLRPLRGGGD